MIVKSLLSKEAEESLRAKIGLILDPDQGLANLFYKGPESKYLCFVGHMTLLANSQLSPCNVKVAIRNT